MRKFNRQIAYMNYQVQDANGEVIDGYRSNRDSWEKVKDTEHCRLMLLGLMILV